MMSPSLLLVLILMSPPVFAGTPTEDPNVLRLQNLFREAALPTAETLKLGDHWYCTKYNATRGTNSQTQRQEYFSFVREGSVYQNRTKGTVFDILHTTSIEGARPRNKDVSQGPFWNRKTYATSVSVRAHSSGLIAEYLTDIAYTRAEKSVTSDARSVIAYVHCENQYRIADQPVLRQPPQARPSRRALPEPRARNSYPLRSPTYQPGLDFLPTSPRRHHHGGEGGGGCNEDRGHHHHRHHHHDSGGNGGYSGNEDPHGGIHHGHHHHHTDAGGFHGGSWDGGGHHDHHQAAYDGGSGGYDTGGGFDGGGGGDSGGGDSGGGGGD